MYLETFITVLGRVHYTALGHTFLLYSIFFSGKTSWLNNVILFLLFTQAYLC